MTNELTKRDETVEPPSSTHAMMVTPEMLQAAVQMGADGRESLSLLRDMQQDERAQWARSEYFAALARFQGLLGPIPRDRDVKNRDGTIRYRYATLDQILKHIREPMTACGLSWRWAPSPPTDEGAEIVCVITHVGGHSEETRILIPGITAGGTNAAQDAGGANTYGRRYSLINALGIQATDDNDAEGVKGGPIDAIFRLMQTLDDALVLRIVADVKEFLSYGDDTPRAAEAYSLLSAVQIKDLWLAPSKGGIWTTKERTRIKTDSEFQAEVQARRKDAGWFERNEQT